MNSGLMQRFIDVNVSQADDQLLIQQGRFDGAGGFGQAGGQLFGGNIQRLGAEVAVPRLNLSQPPDAAEAARIDETHFLPGHVHDQVCVLNGWRAGFFHGHMAAHAQVDVEAVAVV